MPSSDSYAPGDRVQVAQDSPRGTWVSGTVEGRSALTDLVCVRYDDDQTIWWLPPERLRREKP